MTPAGRRRRRKRQADTGIALFAEKFPAAFYVDGFAERRPLKRGVDQDLQKLLAIKRHIIKTALRSYCGSFSYLCAMSAGAVRVDLNGQPAGVVTEEEAAIAKQELAENYPFAA
jgi:ProP effector